jgi:molybdate transport system permease protein
VTSALPSSGEPRQRPVQRRALALALPALVAVALIVVPLMALLRGTDLAALPGHLSDPAVLPALRLSVLTTVTTTAVSIVLGTPLAWLLARSTHPLVPWVRAVVTVPLVLPPVVGGVALLLAYGRNGLVGRFLDTAFGVSIPFTTVAVVLAEIFVAMPFYVVAVEGAMRAVDSRFDEVAATLGASRWRTFIRVGVPMAAPGVAAGAALAWARALGEFGATITFAGNFPGRTQTAPLAVYAALEQSPEAAVSLSVTMLIASLIVLGALRGRWAR